MICTVYISSAKLGLSDREILGIVRASQINNQQLGITGILLYNAGNFMQLIEGDDVKIEGLYEKIQNDTRHHGITRLFSETITHRNFERWSMGYKNLEMMQKLDPELLHPFLNEELNFSIYQHNPYQALHLLETFKRILT